MLRKDLHPDEQAALSAMESILLAKLWIPAVSVLIGLLIQLVFAGIWVGGLRADVQNINSRVQRIESFIDKRQ